MSDDFDLPDGVDADDMDLPDGVDDMDMPDGLEVDEEDKAILAEVKKKGYYHARPKSEQCASPTRLAVSHSPLSNDQDKTESRTKYDAFQKKWDKIEYDSDDDVKVTSSSARIAPTPSAPSEPPKQEPLTSEEAKKLLEHYKSNPIALLRDTSQMKADGVKNYQEGKIDQAVQNWNFAKRAIQQIWDEDLFAGDNAKKEEVRQLQATVNLNLAQVYLKQEKYEACIKACDVTLGVTKDNTKALFRKGSALFATGDTEGARIALRILLKTEPTHAAARTLLQEVKQKEDASKTKLFQGVKQKEQLKQATKEHKAKDIEAAKKTLEGMLATWPDHEGAKNLLKEIVDEQKREKQAEKEAARKMFSGIKADPRIEKEEKKAAQKRKEEEQLELSESPLGWLKSAFCPKRKSGKSAYLDMDTPS